MKVIYYKFYITVFIELFKSITLPRLSPNDI